MERGAIAGEGFGRAAGGQSRGGWRFHYRGRGSGGVARKLSWHLVAGSGNGPYVPAIASVILARKLVAGEGVPVGAMACVGLITLEAFLAEVGDLDITATVLS